MRFRLLRPLDLDGTQPVLEIACGAGSPRLNLTNDTRPVIRKRIRHFVNAPPANHRIRDDTATFVNFVFGSFELRLYKQ
jgi:hypothetical protein